MAGNAVGGEAFRIASCLPAVPSGGAALALLVTMLAAQAIGILAADALALDASRLRVGALAAIGLAAWRLAARPRLAVACGVAAIALTSAAALASRLEAALRDRPAAPAEAAIEGTVAAATRRPSGIELDLVRVVAVEAETRSPARVRIRTGSGDPHAPDALADVLPGDRLRLRARLRAPEARANPGSSDATRALTRSGVGAVGVLVHPSLVARIADREGVRPLAWLHAFRMRAARRLAAEGEGGALLAALALGDRGGLDAARRAEFRQLGLTHLLSVSGLHLVLVAAGAYALLAPVSRRLALARDARRAALALATALAALYALLAGFEVPVQRSLAMLLALVAGVALRRPVRRAAPLVLAGVAILAVDPAALFDPGAQMSFAASAALVLAVRGGEPGRTWRARAAELFQTSALATAATAPVAATLGNVSPWGLVANAAAVPWTGVALMPLAFVAAAAAGLGSDGAVARALVGGPSRIAGASLDAMGWLAAHTPAGFDAQPAWPWVALALAAAAALVAVPSVGVRIAGALAITLGLAWAPAPAVHPSAPRVVALDVAQGDATLVQGREAAVLVDAGTAVAGRVDMGASTVVPALRALGVAQLDLVAASHADLDHRGGLVAVLRAVPTRRLWLPFGALADAGFAPLVAEAAARGVAVSEAGAGSPPLAAGDLAVEVLWPPRVGPSGAGDNDRSLVLRVATPGGRVLLPGDLEAAGERALVASGADLRADVLKLPHHGSRTSSTPELLRAVCGAVAIASAPRFGRFGMPHREVVARAGGAGYAVWWTGRDGAVLVSLGERLWVRGWRER